MLVVRGEVPQAGGRARGGARKEGKGGALGDLEGGRDAAVRLHHEQDAAEPQLVEAPDERLQVARDDRPNVRVQDGRRGAVVVAHLGEEVARRRHVRVRHQLAAERERLLLMLRAGGRVQEGDRDRLDPVLDEDPAGLADRVRVERRDLVAFVVRSLGDAESQVTRDERLGRLQPVIVRRLSRSLPQRERIPEAVRADQAGAGSPAGQESVRGHRRPVDDQLDLGQERLERPAGAGRDLLETGHQAERRVGRRRARLMHDPCPVAAQQEEVCESPAYVDADAVRHDPRSLAVSASSTPLPSGRSATR